MKHNTLLAVAGVIALGATGFAQAGVVQDTSKVTVNVAANCELAPVDDHFINVVSGQSAGSSNGKNILTRCSDQLPYTLEVNTKAGGLLDVQDPNTGRIYEVKFINGFTGQPWGTVANGEAIATTGTGFDQYFPYYVQFNIDQAYGLPQIGTYNGSFEVTQTY